MARRAARAHKPRSRASGPAAAVAAPQAWPSDAEQTLAALRSGLIDALVIPAGPGDSVYALRTFDEIEAANQKLLDSQERLLALVNERERLMQDLHDGCIQSIYAVGLSLEECRRLIREDPKHAARTVADAQASLNLVIQELRSFISGNSPPTAIDLAAELERIGHATRAHVPLFKVEVDRSVAAALAPESAVQLLQIAREGVSNIVRHAKAKSARISLRLRADKVELAIVDDGVGFDPHAPKGTGLGLHHIVARVQKLAGRLRLTSTRMKGSRIVVEIAGSR
jgi:signal transduction histidine kinase